MKDKCGKCGKEIDPDEVAWFCFGEDGYNIGCPCRCLTCWTNMEELLEKTKDNLGVLEVKDE